jgi:hypothetical protein
MPLIFWEGQLLFRSGELAFDLACCCGCCLDDLSDTLCATVLTNNCISSTGGTSTFDLTLVYSTSTVKVWRGFGSHCPTDCDDWYIQIGAECNLPEVVGSGAKFYICQDSCTVGDYLCANSPPDLTDAGRWTPIGTTDGSPCLPGTYSGVPLSSCNTAGDYDCEFNLTLTEGACP